jgi:hypothetical protein
MTACALCGEATPVSGRFCPCCGYHVLGDELLSDPGLTQIQIELGRALEYFCFRDERWTLHTLADARQPIEYFDLRDRQEIEEKTVKALTEARPVSDPLGAEVLRPLRKIIGASLEHSREYVEGLRKRGVIRTEPRPASGTLEGVEPFSSTLYSWVRCKDGE